MNKCQILIWDGVHEDKAYLLSLKRNLSNREVGKLLRKKINTYETFGEFYFNISQKSYFVPTPKIRKELDSIFWVDFGSKKIGFTEIDESLVYSKAKMTEKGFAGELEYHEVA